MTLTEAQRRALNWLAEQANGSIPLAAVPDDVIGPLRSLIGTKLVRERRMVSNFPGVAITAAGRRAVTEIKS